MTFDPWLGWCRIARAPCCPLEKQFALTCVSGERCGAFELSTGLVEATELEQEVATYAR